VLERLAGQTTDLVSRNEHLRQELEGLPSGDGRFLFTGSGKT